MSDNPAAPTDAELFADLLVVDADTSSRLHQRLVHAAGLEGLLDISYRVIDSPVGPLLLAATDIGLVRVAYRCEDHDQVLISLAERISPRILEAPARLDAIAQELEEYFAGQRQAFDVALDLRLVTGFRREVLSQLPAVGYGHTASYACIARAAGRPRAVRAAATACATNPLPVVLPCHRVIRADGSIGRYLGGSAAKESLLKLESAP